MDSIRGAENVQGNRLHYIDLFSGIGGFALGAYWARIRFDKHYFSEVDKYCVELYQKRFPDAIALGDVTKIKSIPTGNYVITGGFPCQPFSVAGKRKGEKDERNLWPEMLRVIRLCQPSWVVCENVPGAIKYIKGVVKPDLENEGYEVWPFSISATTIGAPHRRERIWIVAYPRQQPKGTKGIRFSKESKYCKTKKIGTMSGNRFANSSQKVSNTIGKYDDNAGHGTSEICRKRSEQAEVQGCKNVPNPTKPGLEGQEPESKLPREQQRLFTERCGWEFEPSVGRLAHGISNRVDRLKGLGNAIVPQIAELLFNQIKEIIGG